VAIPTCEFNPPYELKAGDELRLTSMYSDRHIPNGHTYHEAVMGLALFYAERRSATPCEVQLKTACGNPLPVDSQKCFECARQAFNKSKLDMCVKNANVWDKGHGQVRFFCLTDAGIKRPYPIVMASNPTTGSSSSAGVIEKYEVESKSLCVSPQNDTKRRKTSQNTKNSRQRGNRIL